MAYADAEEWGRRGLDDEQDSSYADYVEGFLDRVLIVSPGPDPWADVVLVDRYGSRPFEPADCGHGIGVVEGCGGCPPF